MIDEIDRLLRVLFMAEVPAITSTQQVRFEPPDDAWRTAVANLNQLALNVYLVDLHENRKLRSNERVRRTLNGVVTEEPAPARVECHYLITAWSPAQPAPAVEPAVDEHLLLSQVSAVLMTSAPLNPSRIYTPAVLPTVPEIIRNADLPTEVLPVEGFPKLSEFWATMGANGRWKPAVYLIVTVPVELQTEIAGPLVTTTISDYRLPGSLDPLNPDANEILIQIGGHVLDATIDPPVPLPGAWVRLESAAGEPVQVTTTDQLGRFVFGDLRSGDYQLRARAAGFGETVDTVEIPSASSTYDLRFP